MVLFANSDTLHDVRDQKSSNSKRELKTRISKRRAATKGFKTSVIKLTFNVCFVFFFFCSLPLSIRKSLIMQNYTHHRSSARH